MSSIETLLISMMDEQPHIRTHAEDTFMQSKQDDPNQLVTAMLSVIRDDGQVKGLRAFAVVILRKILVVDDFGIFFYRLHDQVRLDLMNTALDLGNGEADRSVRMKVVDLVSQIAVSMFQNKDAWRDMMNWCLSLGTSEDTEAMVSSFRLFEELSPFFAEIDYMTGNIEMILNMYVKAMNLSNNNIETAICALKSFQYVIESFYDFRQLLQSAIPSMVSVITNAINQVDEDMAETAVQVFVNIAGFDSGFFKPTLNDLTNLMLEISQSFELQDSLNQIAAEFLVTLCENKPTMINKIPEFVDNCVKSLLMMMLQIPEVSLEEWDVVTREKDRTNIFMHLVAETFIDRISISLSADVVLPIVWKYIQEFIVDPDWKKRYTALKAISIISEGCVDVLVTGIEDVLEMTVKAMEDQDPRIVWAGIHAVGIMASDLAPNFQNDYSDMLLPKLLNIAQTTPYSKVRDHAMSCLVNILDFLDRPFIKQFLPDLMSTTIDTIQQNKHPLITSSAVQVLTSIISTACADIVPYFNDIMQFLKNLFSGTNDTFFQANIIECISVTAVAVGKDVFANELNEVISLLKHLQIEVTQQDDPLQEAILPAWVRIATCLGNDFAPYLSYLMDPLLEVFNTEQEVYKNTDEMDDEEYQDYLETFGDQLTAGSTFLQLLKQLEDTICPYADVLSKIAVRILEHSHYKLRSIGYQMIPLLIKAVKIYAEKNNRDNSDVSSLFKFVFTAVYDGVKKEVDLDTLQFGLQCFYESIEFAGPNVLADHEVDNIIGFVKYLFSEIRDRRNFLLAADQDGDGDYNTWTQEQLHYNANLTHQLAEIITPVLKHYKNSALNALNRHDIMGFLEELIESGENSEIQLAVCIFVDLVEVGGDITSGVISQFLPRVIQFAFVDDPGIRQACVYGFGECAKAGPAVEPYLEKTVECLVQVIDKLSINVSYALSRDNAISSVGKVIKYQNHVLGDSVHQIIKMWLGWLPAVQDKIEAIIIHENMCDLIQNYPPMLGNNNDNLSEILRIFSHLRHSSYLVNGSTRQQITNILATMKEQMPDQLSHVYSTLPEKTKIRLGEF